MKNFSTADALQQHFEKEHALGAAQQPSDAGVCVHI